MKTPPEQLRPISSRALTSALDTLRPWLAGAAVLDLFSGQGRFGLGALEEGAAQVTFVELDRAAARALQKATARYGSRAHVAAEDALGFLGRAAGQKQVYDLVFADPPFPFWNEEFSARLYGAVAGVTQEGGIFLVKHPKRVVASEANQGFYLWKSSLFGESRLIYLKYGKETDGDHRAGD